MYRGSCRMYIHGYPQVVHSQTDWHVPMCAGVKSGYLPYILAFNIHLTVL